ncbi:hypothetical protein TeGR_g1734, partial [Tetraparma gracilis]
EENAKTYNPFARLPNKPKILWDVGIEEDDKKGPSGATAAVAAAEAEAKRIAEEAAAAQRPISPDNAGALEGGGHQFDLTKDEIEQERKKREADAQRKKEAALAGGGDRQRKGLSFSEYLKKKAAAA